MWLSVKTRNWFIFLLLIEKESSKTQLQVEKLVQYKTWYQNKNLFIRRGHYSFLVKEIKSSTMRDCYCVLHTSSHWTDKYLPICSWLLLYIMLSQDMKNNINFIIIRDKSPGLMYTIVSLPTIFQFETMAFPSFPQFSLTSMWPMTDYNTLYSIFWWLWQICAMLSTFSYMWKHTICCRLLPITVAYPLYVQAVQWTRTDINEDLFKNYLLILCVQNMWSMWDQSLSLHQGPLHSRYVIAILHFTWVEFLDVIINHPHHKKDIYLFIKNID